MKSRFDRREFILLAAAAVSTANAGRPLGTQPGQSQDTLTSLRSSWKTETDPVRKAKLLTKVGEEQLTVLRREAAAGKYEDALKAIEEYRDDVKETHAILKGMGRDVEKKPAGFKQLQIHLRHGLRDLNQTILQLPQDMKQFFEPVRRELDNIDKELLDELFPRKPEKKKEPPKNKN